MKFGGFIDEKKKRSTSIQLPDSELGKGKESV